MKREKIIKSLEGDLKYIDAIVGTIETTEEDAPAFNDGYWKGRQVSIQDLLIMLKD